MIRGDGLVGFEIAPRPAGQHGGGDVIRPAEHLLHGMDGPVVVVSGRVCALLNRLLGLDKVRAEVRGQNAQLDTELLAIRLAGIAFTEGSATGRSVAPVTEPATHSNHNNDNSMGTTTAATLLGITDRAVRAAIAEKRLAATQDDGHRWRITQTDLAAYAAQR